MKKAIIIGASSGIGKELAITLAKKGYEVGLMARRTDIVTDIKSGFVDTKMAKGEGKFWVATPQKAAEQIYSVIINKNNMLILPIAGDLLAWLLS